jgi:hypothetical protein
MKGCVLPWIFKKYLIEKVMMHACHGSKMSSMDTLRGYRRQRGDGESAARSTLSTQYLRTDAKEVGSCDQDNINQSTFYNYYKFINYYKNQWEHYQYY